MASTIKDVGLHDFEQSVLEESRKRPVVVDFWASWCGPCRMLGPILEKLAEEFKGSFLLAKVDTEANPGLAQHFSIRSIPCVKVFQNGKVVDQLIGAHPEEEVRAFLRRQCPVAADHKFAAATMELQNGRLDEAKALLEEALNLDTSHPGALFELGKIFAAEGNYAAAEALWDSLPAGSPLWNQSQTLRQALQLRAVCDAGGGLEACALRAAREPESLEARYSNGCCQLAAGDFRAALEEFLYVVRRHKNFNNQAARKAMLTVFSLVGERSDLAEEFRKRLAQALFESIALGS